MELGHVEFVPRGEFDGLPLEHNTHSDSDMGVMNDSEDDSQYDNLDLAEYEDPIHVIVSGTGNPSVNGAYIEDGHFESAC